MKIIISSALVYLAVIGMYLYSTARSGKKGSFWITVLFVLPGFAFLAGFLSFISYWFLKHVFSALG